MSLTKVALYEKQPEVLAVTMLMGNKPRIFPKNWTVLERVNFLICHAHVKPSDGEHPCLIERGFAARNGAGYPYICVPGLKGSYSAAQVILALQGINLKGKEACHTCNNPECIQPNHLYADTHKGNMQYMAHCGRSGHQRRNK